MLTINIFLFFYRFFISTKQFRRFVYSSRFHGPINLQNKIIGGLG